jgi:hypothetical protein
MSALSNKKQATFSGGGRWPSVPRADAIKVTPARCWRQETTMTLNWIAKQLKMGTAGSLANLLRKAK